MPDSSLPTPITEDQLQLVTHTAENAVRKFEKRRTRSSRVGYLALVVGLVLGFSINAHDTNGAREAIVQSGRAVAVDGCNRDFRSTERLRATFQRLDDANEISFKSGRITQEQRTEAHDFYIAQIKLTPLPDCNDALNLITDNPKAKIVVPVPLRPTSKGN